jgi:hypothetical protein
LACVKPPYRLLLHVGGTATAGAADGADISSRQGGDYLVVFVTEKGDKLASTS